MIRQLLFPLIFSLQVFCVSAQHNPPTIQWQKCIGGTYGEYYTDILKTKDGGILASTISGSRDGDFYAANEPGQLMKLWLVKMNEKGLIHWKRSYGNRLERYKIKETSDGGYVIVSTTYDNDKGEFTNYHGASTDVVVIKIKSDGTPEWQKCFGGRSNDNGFDVIESNDGFVIAALTISANGDVTGTPYQAGYPDPWIFKIDRTGKLIWEKRIPGYLYEHVSGLIAVNNGFVFQTWTDGGTVRYKFDYNGNQLWFNSGGNTKTLSFSDFLQTSDKGFLVQSTGVVDIDQFPDYHGSTDALIQKIDSSGKTLWSKSLGGKKEDQLKSAIELPDGGFLLTGSTNSTDGDVEGIHKKTGVADVQNDVWVVKLDKNGKTVWQKCYGGSGKDDGVKIYRHPDGNFAVAASSGSNDGDVVSPGPIPPYSNVWIIKFDINGNLLFEKTFGGSGADVIENLVFTSDNEMAFAATTTSTDYDIQNSFNINSPNSQQQSDLWVVKTGAFNLIRGVVFVDANQNGVKDSIESQAPNVFVTVEKPGYSLETEPSGGDFIIRLDTGSYTTTVVPANDYYQILPVSKQTVFNSFGNTDSIIFAMVPKPGKVDLNLSFFAVTPSRPGFETIYLIKILNAGTEIVSNKAVQLVKDAKLGFVKSSSAPISNSGDTLSWNISLLEPGQSVSIRVIFKNPVAIQIGDTLDFTAAVDSTNDITLQDNFAFFRHFVTGSYDPNDKQENYGGVIEKADLSNGKSLQYLIRFQNTGNDTAFNITVTDTLESTLDWNSFRMVDASHPYKLEIRDKNKVSWTFENIRLVDSIHNEPLSHGYISFKMKPKSSLVPGDSIRNKAVIYFDFNQPVITNIAKTFVRSIPKPVPVPVPVFEGLGIAYCETAGTQKIKINNLPDSNIVVVVKLNQKVLAIAADSTFSITSDLLIPGEHDLTISYSNSTETKQAAHSFSVAAAVNPTVELSANSNIVSNPTDQVIITATNLKGGGAAPIYKFSRDRDFLSSLQAPGNSDHVSMSTSMLSVGSNWIYVSMKTSETCFRSQTGIDSVRIERKINGTGIQDPDNPGKVILVYPNPFISTIYIQGLNPEKSYTVYLYDQSGRKISSQVISNVSSAEIQRNGLPAGKYMVTLFDSKKGKKIGTISLLKQ